MRDASVSALVHCWQGCICIRDTSQQSVVLCQAGHKMLSIAHNTVLLLCIHHLNNVRSHSESQCCSASARQGQERHTCLVAPIVVESKVPVLLCTAASAGPILIVKDKDSSALFLTSLNCICVHVSCCVQYQFNKRILAAAGARRPATAHELTLAEKRASPPKFAPLLYQATGAL